MAVNPKTLNLQTVVEVVINISPEAAPRPTFNQALFVGPGTVIGSAERLRQYQSPDAMIADGFATNSPEVIAAQLYFGQSPSPNILWIGMKDTSAVKTIAVNAEGSGYSVNDVLTLVQSGGSGGTAKVATIVNGELETLALTSSHHGTGYSVNDILTLAGGTGGTIKVLTVDAGAVATFEIHAPGSGYSLDTAVDTTASPSGGTGCQFDISAVKNGEVATVTLLSGGTGYSTGTGLATTVSPSGGTGCTINIAAIGESFLQAMQACRAQNLSWYIGACLGAVAQDHEDIAAWVQSTHPSTVYGFTTSDAGVLNGTAGNICLLLQAAGYNRVISQYATTQNGDNPAAPYAICAIIGYAMGQNTGLANSSYTLKFKQEVGIITEPLVPTQIYNIEGANCNCYLNYANYYNIFEQGVMANGQFFDEIINLDMLANNIQLSVMDLLYGNPKIPDTDPGVTQIIHTINVACENAISLGFLAPGTWTGLPILNLKTGDMLPRGYMVQAPAVSTQSIADRSARKSPPIYVAIKEAGAIHSVLIGVYVDR